MVFLFNVKENEHEQSKTQEEVTFLKCMDDCFHPTMRIEMKNNYLMHLYMARITSDLIDKILTINKSSQRRYCLGYRHGARRTVPVPIIKLNILFTNGINKQK